jgi:hypothetical protein
MMATTHAFSGLAVAVGLLGLLPNDVAAAPLLAAAFVGGLLPDLDLVASHRRTLHYPGLLPAATLVLVAGASVSPSPVLLAVTFAVGSAALHCVSDVLGGSVEAKPWTYSSDHAVFNHVLGRWHRPRRYVRYSGAPEDFLVGAAFAVVAVQSAATGAGVDRLLLGAVVCSGVYTLLRRRLHAIPNAVAPLVPARLRRIFPAVRVVESDDGTTVDVRFGR